MLMPFEQNTGKDKVQLAANDGVPAIPTGISQSQSPNGPQRDQQISFDDFIEKQPGWLLRSGIILLSCSVVMAVALASFIRYPDKLAAPFINTTENPHIDVVTLSGGQIAAWYAADNQQVDKNEALAYIDNPASLDDVETFAAFVERAASITNIPGYLELQPPENLRMGDLRQVYTTYVQALTSFQHLLRQRIVFDKMSTLMDNAQKHRQLGTAKERQLRLFDKELSLAEKDHQRNLQLNRDGVVSDLDLEKNETLLLQKQQQLENLKSNIIQNSIEIAQLNTQWLELQDARATSVNDYLIKLAELSLQFRNEHSQWQMKYVVTAPIAGTVSIAPGMAENRTVGTGETIAAIIPENAGDNIVARIATSASGIGKVENGNRVLLHLDAYPYKEYGAVETTIAKVSLLPVQDKEAGLVYEVTCGLSLPITSNTGKGLAFRQKLTGTAQIITKDKSILQRLFERLFSLKS